MFQCFIENQLIAIFYTCFVNASTQETHSYPTTNPHLLTPHELHKNLNSNCQVSRQTSRKCIRGSRSSAASEYQCSGPQKMIQLGKNLLPTLRGSNFLGILLTVFIIFAATVLGSILLIIFSIWF